MGQGRRRIEKGEEIREEGELGRSRTRVRRTRRSGAKLKEVCALRLMKGQVGG